MHLPIDNTTIMIQYNKIKTIDQLFDKYASLLINTAVLFVGKNSYQVLQPTLYVNDNWTYENITRHYKP